MPHLRTRERIFGSLAVFGSFVGGVGLILLSIFDTKRHSTLHRGFLLIFIVGVAISAIFTIAEVCISTPRCVLFSQYTRSVSLDQQRLRLCQKAQDRLHCKGYHSHDSYHIGHRLRHRFIYKPQHWRYEGPCVTRTSVLIFSKAILEWIIAFGFTLYLLTFFYDLKQAKSMHKGQLSRERMLESRNNGMRVRTQ